MASVPASPPGSGPAPRKPGAPIATSIFLLVAGATLTAILVNIAITFRGPPPRPQPVYVEAVRAVIAGRSLGHGPRRLDVRDQPAPPEPRPGEHADARRTAAIARMLGARPADVRGYYAEEDPDVPPEFNARFTLGVRRGGGWRVVATPTRPWLTGWHWVTLGATLVALLLLAWPAWRMARRMARPLEALAAAADRLRLGERIDLPEEGPREVRQVTRAFAAMQERLGEQAAARTAMLAAIAHDMGTPLARVAFWIEQLPDEARTRAAADLGEMRGMIGTMLRFARDERVSRERVRIDLGSLLDSLVEDMSMAGSAVTLEPGPAAVVLGDSPALRRMFANLIENGLRYGGTAAVAWDVADGRASVRVDDTGPGFPEDWQPLLDPFVRGERSRNRETGGIGLGLATVRSIAEAHGGHVTLGNRAGGGGRAEVTLPLA